MANKPWFVLRLPSSLENVTSYAAMPACCKEIGKLTGTRKRNRSGFTDLGLEVLDILLDNNRQ